MGYRAASASASTGGPDYVAVVSVFISVFIVVWAALVVLLVVRCFFHLTCRQLRAHQTVAVADSKFLMAWVCLFPLP